MSVYRVTIPVEFVVEINEDNTEVNGPPALQGDSALVAVRRAMWVLYRQDIARYDAATFREIQKAKRAIGIKNVMVREHERDVPVTMSESVDAAFKEFLAESVRRNAALKRHRASQDSRDE